MVNHPTRSPRSPLLDLAAEMFPLRGTITRAEMADYLRAVEAGGLDLSAHPQPPVWAAAERIAARLSDLGHDVLSVSHSQNRDGGYSAYIAVADFRERLRVSDHGHNSDWHDDVPVLPDATDDDLRAIFVRAAESRARHDAALAAEIAARDAREAPFRARFRAAPQHEQTDIIVECYPDLLDNKAGRREVRERWLP